MSTSMNMLAVLQAMPINSIESEHVATLEGLFPKKKPLGSSVIHFFMPPAGQAEPYISAVEALATLYIHCGLPADAALTKATGETDTLLRALPTRQQVPLYHGSQTVNVPICIPVQSLLSHLRLISDFPVGLLDWIDNALQVTLKTPLLSLGRVSKLRLSELPALPPPREMTEFFVGLPSDLCWDFPSEGDRPRTDAEILAPFYQWREQIRPAVDRLEAKLGQRVYLFSDLNDPLDDDYCHRFLTLHCWCTLQPESTLVRHLVKVSGARDVAQLKEGLIDPSNYTHPFVTDRSCYEWEISGLSFHWRESWGDSQTTDDAAYLQTFIDGTADTFAADVLERLEPMFTKYENDTSMMALLNMAADAYSDAAVKAALAALAEDGPGQ